MSVSRAHRRISKRVGRKLMLQGWNEFENVIDTSEAKESMAKHYEDGYSLPYATWKNNFFIVQVFKYKTAWGVLDKAMIRRNDEKPVHNWAVFQRIKNEIFGEERTAVEVYPKQSKLIDQANLYWLWVFPEDYECPIEMN